MPPAPPHSLTAIAGRALGAPLDIVWAALTRAECLSVWYVRETELELHPGGRYRNSAGDAGEVLEVEAPHRMVLSWENPKDAPGSRVTFEVQEMGAEETRVRITHAGIGGEAAHHRLMEGWSWAIDSLENFLKHGEGLPYEPWVELQAELRRREREKGAEQAAREREEAGVVLHPIPELGTRSTARPPPVDWVAPDPVVKSPVRPVKKKSAAVGSKKKAAAKPRASGEARKKKKR